VVVKDARHKRMGIRWLSRWLLARERAVLQRLGAIDEVPHLVSTIDRDAIVLTMVPGRALDSRRFRERPRAIFEQLLDLTRRLHAVGVFHLDLHHRTNLLLDDEGRLHLVDFGAAVVPGPLGRAVFGRLLRDADFQAAYKYLARFSPENLTDDEARVVVRQRMLRRLWPFSPHSPRELRQARKFLAASRRARTG